MELQSSPAAGAASARRSRARSPNDGWSVVVSARSRDQIDAVAAETGGRAVPMDVASRDSVEEAFAEIGHVDLLVANAGIGGEADFWHTFEVNVLGVHHCCEAASQRAARGS